MSLERNLRAAARMLHHTTGVWPDMLIVGLETAVELRRQGKVPVECSLVRLRRPAFWWGKLAGVDVFSIRNKVVLC